MHLTIKPNYLSKLSKNNRKQLYTHTGIEKLFLSRCPLASSFRTFSVYNLGQFELSSTSHGWHTRAVGRSENARECVEMFFVKDF